MRTASKTSSRSRVSPAVTPTDITCTTGASATAGKVAVTVVNYDGQPSSLPDGYEYTGKPVIDSVAPSTGDTGTRVTINGSNLRANPSSIKIGTVDCPIYSYVSDSQVICTAGSKVSRRRPASAAAAWMAPSFSRYSAGVILCVGYQPSA